MAPKKLDLEFTNKATPALLLLRQGVCFFLMKIHIECGFCKCCKPVMQIFNCTFFLVSKVFLKSCKGPKLLCGLFLAPMGLLFLVKVLKAESAAGKWRSQTWPKSIGRFLCELDPSGNFLIQHFLKFSKRTFLDGLFEPFPPNLVGLGPEANLPIGGGGQIGWDDEGLRRKITKIPSPPPSCPPGCSMEHKLQQKSRWTDGHIPMLLLQDQEW